MQWPHVAQSVVPIPRQFWLKMSHQFWEALRAADLGHLAPTFVAHGVTSVAQLVAATSTSQDLGVAKWQVEAILASTLKYETAPEPGRTDLPVVYSGRRANFGLAVAAGQPNSRKRSLDALDDDIVPPILLMRHAFAHTSHCVSCGKSHHGLWRMRTSGHLERVWNKVGIDQQVSISSLFVATSSECCGHQFHLWCATASEIASDPSSEASVWPGWRTASRHWDCPAFQLVTSTRDSLWTWSSIPATWRF